MNNDIFRIKLELTSYLGRESILLALEKIAQQVREYDDEDDSWSHEGFYGNWELKKLND